MSRDRVVYQAALDAGRSVLNPVLKSIPADFPVIADFIGVEYGYRSDQLALLHLLNALQVGAWSLTLKQEANRLLPRVAQYLESKGEHSLAFALRYGLAIVNDLLKGAT